MSEWKETELRGLINHKKGFAFKSATYKDSGRLIVRVSDTTSNSIDINSCVRIDEIIASNYKDYELSTGDIIIMTVGSWPDNPASVVGKVICVPTNADKALLNQNAVRIRGKGKINKYLYYRLKNNDFSGYIVNNAQGSANQASITLEDIFSFKFNLPSEKEQCSIASILSSLDDKIDLLHRQNATLEALAETLFRQWFMEEAMEDWKNVDLEYITKRITDGSHSSPPTIGNGLPMASVKDMHTWGININSCRKISKFDFDELIRNDCRPLKNDIVIAKDGSYLKHVFVAPEDLNVVILSSIAILRPNGKYNPLLLTTYLKMDSTIGQLENIVSGAVIPRIVLKDFRKFKIQLPPIEIQNKALKFIEPIYHKCWQNINQIRTLTTLRDTLLPKLMSGEVRVKM